MKVIQACREAGGVDLICYRTDTGLQDVSADHVNDFLRDLAGESFSAKDFRTWGGTAVTTRYLVERPVPEDEKAVESDSRRPRRRR